MGFAVRWGKLDLKAIERKLAAEARKEGLAGWRYSPEFDQARTAKAYGLKPSEWKATCEEDKAEMLTVVRSERTMAGWEAHVTRPKPDKG